MILLLRIVIVNDTATILVVDTESENMDQVGISLTGKCKRVLRFEPMPPLSLLAVRYATSTSKWVLVDNTASLILLQNSVNLATRDL